MCGVSAFKRHCAFGFWKGSLIVENASDEAMDQLGRITQLGDLRDCSAPVAEARSFCFLVVVG